MDSLQNLASRAYSAMRVDPAPQDSASYFQKSAQDFLQTLAEADKAAQDAVAGTGDSHRLVTALAQSELAVETMVAIRNKVVDAYQEILRMAV